MTYTTQDFMAGACVTADTILPGRWNPRKRRTIREIIQNVATEHDMTVSELMTPSRKPIYAHKRQQAMWEAREAGYTLGQIALAFGFDHTTIIHGIRAEEGRRND